MQMRLNFIRLLIGLIRYPNFPFWSLKNCCLFWSVLEIWLLRHLLTKD